MTIVTIRKVMGIVVKTKIKNAMNKVMTITMRTIIIREE